MSWTVIGLIVGRGKRFSVLQNVWTGSVACPVSCSLGTRGLFFLPPPWVKQLVCQVSQLLPSSAEAKNERSCTSAPQYGLMTCSVMTVSARHVKSLSGSCAKIRE